VKKNKIFIAKSLEIGQNVFQVKTLSAYFKKLNEFIALLKLPKRYGDFNNVKNVSDANIQFLNKHFNGVVRNKQDMAKYVFSHIKP
jgi:hypothetical protein